MNPDRAVEFQSVAVAGVLGGNQSVLNPQGPGAYEIAALSWLLFAGATAILLGVVALGAYALLARRERRAWMARGRFILAAGAAFPLVALSALLLRGLSHSSDLDRGSPAGALRIEVTGEQWWWRVHYQDADGNFEFSTANEIRIPVGRPIELSLRSADVIHSFWVPNLAGKLDMIPGRVNRLRLAADRPGEFRGQCAEYCGGPHARMALYVVAETPEAFEAWHAAQRRPAGPQTASMMRGQTLFGERGCGVCHQVRGTTAAGTRGPDLTHVGGRLSLGAGTSRNGAAALAAWITSNQHLKPENLMPSFDMLAADEVDAIAAYLESLN